MNFLLDTDMCVFYLRGNQAIRDRLAVADPENVGISSVTLAEPRYGAACSARPEENHQLLDDFIAGLTVIDMNAVIAGMYGEIKAELRRHGLLLEDFDLAIGATALVVDLTLVTNNEEHFRRIPGLRIENWLGRPDAS
jgi:tRNA(fMet)-specific endonuclease VapC